jgi:hypothetical protein
MDSEINRFTSEFILLERLEQFGLCGKTLFINGIKAIMDARREDVHRC